MDIGTAKPTLAERAAVVHHLIDILEPTQSYSAAQFRTDALRLIAEIVVRGHQPLLVGGTFLYLKALLEGLHDLPDADPVIRARLDAEAAEHGWDALHQRLAQIDPDAAQRLSPNDTQRIQRALEVWYATGQTLTAHWQAQKQSNAALPYQWRCLGVLPERNVLHQRIAQRLNAMFAHDFVDEVAQLYARGDLHLGLPSMRCVGYRQVWEHLDGVCDATTMRDKALFATRQLAKRQVTWMRGHKNLQIITPEDWQMLKNVLK
jgi:tRNA dimethylallyltransferase